MNPERLDVWFIRHDGLSVARCGAQVYRHVRFVDANPCIGARCIFAVFQLDCTSRNSYHLTLTKGWSSPDKRPGRADNSYHAAVELKWCVRIMAQEVFVS